MEVPDMTLQTAMVMAFGAIALCMFVTNVLLWFDDRDVAIIMLPATFIAIAMFLTSLGHLAPAIVILSVVTLLRLRGYAVRRWGDYTLACLLFRQHEWCEDHLRCGCPHHDEYIHREMAKK